MIEGASDVHVMFSCLASLLFFAKGIGQASVVVDAGISVILLPHVVHPRHVSLMSLTLLLLSLDRSLTQMRHHAPVCLRQRSRLHAVVRGGVEHLQLCLMLGSI